ncbi:hypothetical protein DRQ18_00310 [bacterium]|nr:MAG: hypothetical protein DRQ18_00310 [bacterium]
MIMLFFLTEVETFLNPSLVLKFAQELEREGDTFRAITEYKRYAYLVPEKRDSIYFHIVRLYMQEKLYPNALDVLMKINRRDTVWGNLAGYLLLKTGNHEEAGKYLHGKKRALFFAYTGKYDSLKLIIPVEPPELKSKLYAAFLSTIVPGLGRMYAGRVGDGIFSLLAIFGTGMNAYYMYEKGNKPLFYFNVALAAGLYLGDIYGSWVAAKRENEKRKRKFIEKVEEEVLK